MRFTALPFVLKRLNSLEIYLLTDVLKTSIEMSLQVSQQFDTVGYLDACFLQ